MGIHDSNRLPSESFETLKLSEIRFDYLPESPLNNGWSWAYGGNNAAKIRFAPAANAPEKGCLSVQTSVDYSVVYDVPKEVGEVCDALQVSIKFKGEDDTMFWTEVEMANADGSKWQKCWVKHYRGCKPSKRYNPPDDGEWVRWMSGRELANGWTAFSISLKESVDETWGKNGWIYKSLTKISIRGNISISPVKLLKFEREEASSAGIKYLGHETHSDLLDAQTREVAPEERGIKGDDMNFDEKDKQSAGNMVFNIGSVQGNVGNVSHSQAIFNNYHSIHKTLLDSNVPMSERHELEGLMEKLKTASPEEKPSLIQRGKDWIVKNKEFLGTSLELVTKAIVAAGGTGNQ